MQLRCNLDGIKKLHVKKFLVKIKKITASNLLVPSSESFKKITCHLNTFSKKRKISFLIVFPAKLDAIYDVLHGKMGCFFFY